MALYHATQEYFAPLPDTVIIIACTQIYHAISEYSSGQRKAKNLKEIRWNVSGLKQLLLLLSY
jgi:hypothetical protein